MSFSPGLLPPRSPLNSPVVVLGAGRGLAAVLQALRRDYDPLTVIVSIAVDWRYRNESHHSPTEVPVEDLRRSLQALAGDEGAEGALARAIGRPLTIERLGRHPLGNLMIGSVAAAFGDYGRASAWLGEQLGIDGAVLPATVGPVRRRVARPNSATDQSSRNAGRELRTLQFVGDRLGAPEPAITAIENAHLVLLAPGSLYRSVLSTAAVPDLASALKHTPARVLWIANLERASDEVPAATGLDHLRALRLHGVRTDLVLYDPSAGLRYDAAELKAYGVEPVRWSLRSADNPAFHDPERLRAALTALTASRPAGAITR